MVRQQAITSQDGWKAHWDDCDPSKQLVVLRWDTSRLRTTTNYPHPGPQSVRCQGFHHHPQQILEMPKQAMDFCWEEAWWDTQYLQVQLEKTIPSLRYLWTQLDFATTEPSSSSKNAQPTLRSKSVQYYLQTPTTIWRIEIMDKEEQLFSPTSPLSSSRERIQMLAYSMVEDITPHFWKRPVTNCSKKQACIFLNIAQVFSGPGDSWCCIF